jgi:hypothetical protein
MLASGKAYNLLLLPRTSALARSRPSTENCTDNHTADGILIAGEKNTMKKAA